MKKIIFLRHKRPKLKAFSLSEKRKFGAFSLVEMLVTLITVSLVMAALTPVVTKKLKSNSVIIGGGSSEGVLTQDCSKFGDSCGLCYENRCVSCVKSCLTNEALDIAQCSCKACSSNDMFGVNCLRCDIGNCSQCNSSYYVNDGQCVICAIGNMCDGTNSTNCGNGKYTDSEGQTSCKNCEAGYKCITGIRSICTATTYSAANASSCSDCPAGYKCPGGTNKQQCTGNEYQPDTKQSSCLTCAAGKYVSDDRKSCVICPVGYKCTGDGTKKACDEGYFNGSTSLSENCTICPDGKFNTGTGNTTCSACTIANCKVCEKAGGATCKTCADGYELNNGSCQSSDLIYSFTGSYSETVNANGKQKIYLKSNGTFTAKNSKKVTLFLVGGGGGGGCGYEAGGGGGGGGYTNNTIYTFQANQSVSITIGSGGSGGSYPNNGTVGETTKFGTITASGGSGGKASTWGCNACGSGGAPNGGNPKTNGSDGTQFDGEWFGGGGGGGWGPTSGGKGGGAGCSAVSVAGNSASNNTGGGGGGGGYASKSGGSGGSGIIVILSNY